VAQFRTQIERSQQRGGQLTYQNQLVDALYSSTGGITAAFSVMSGMVQIDFICNRMWNLSRQSLADENNFQRFINLRQGFNETG